MATRPTGKAARYGKISRMEAEGIVATLLTKPGAYLLRESERKPGCFVLTVFSGSHFEHYVVEKFASGKYGIGDGVRFETLEQLIEHYHTDRDGICCTLDTNVYALDETMNPPTPPIPARRMSAEPKQSSKPALPSAALKKPPPPVVEAPMKALTIEDVAIPVRYISTSTKLGEGEFGVVLSGVLALPGKPLVAVAVKALKPGASDDEMRREAGTMVALNHPNVTRMLGMCFDAATLQLVLELVPHGAINAYLRENETRIDQPKLLSYIMQVCEGMLYLESMHVIHRDLAARNVLVGDNDQVKVSDFGMSRSSDYYTAKQRGRWPLKWYAPEAILYSKFTHKGDVWSFAVTAWEIFSYGVKPYRGLTGQQVVKSIQLGGRLSRPEQCPEAIYDVLLDCWIEDTTQRLSFAQVRERLSAQGIKQPPVAKPDTIYAGLYSSQLVFDETENPEELAQDGEEEMRYSNLISLRTGLSADKLSFGEELSAGPYSTVYKGSFGKESVAIKALLRKHQQRATDILLTKAESIQRAPFRHLLTMHGIANSADRGLLAVFELLPLGSLRPYLQREQARLPLAMRLRFITQLASALNHLHSCGIVHSDVAAKNLFLASPTHLKLGTG